MPEIEGIADQTDPDRRRIDRIRRLTVEFGEAKTNEAPTTAGKAKTPGNGLLPSSANADPTIMTKPNALNTFCTPIARSPCRFPKSCARPPEWRRPTTPRPG
jgi:hypothetical protein